MSPPYVWTFRRCPFAIRARLALDVSGQDVEYREILLREKPAKMLEDSPKGTVPVCVLPSGEVIDESLDIMRWALSKSDPESWCGRNDEENAAIATWIALGDAFKPNLDRYKYANRHPEETREPTRRACLGQLKQLDDALAQTPWLCGDRATLADAALFPFVRQFHFSEVKQLAEWELDSLIRWLDTWLASERFERVMVKRALWADVSSSS
ncbi:MAG: glutathione S-transferase N-terminal domain-containing protein [Polyangiales bacterium]